MDGNKTVIKICVYLYMYAEENMMEVDSKMKKQRGSL